MKAELTFSSIPEVEGELFIDGNFVDDINLKNVHRPFDYWQGFEYDGKEYDINIWEDDDTKQTRASIYKVVDGKTQTTGDIVDVKVKVNSKFINI